MFTQQEIDHAFKKMRARTTYYVEYEDRRGCWPNNVIPYIIDDTFEPEQVENIHKHFNQIQNRTCLRWVPLDFTIDVDKYVEFIHSDRKYRCKFIEYGDTEDEGISTKIYLGDGCFPPELESAIHEMIHALGFTHEHQRIDRDCYVEVTEEAALENDQFKMVYDDLSFETWPYDKRSIVHYPRTEEIIRDKDEPFWGYFWRYRLGDTHGWWGNEGKRLGKLTYMDVYKLNYRFCGAPDFCQTRPEVCLKIEEDEKRDECKDLYMDIAKGIAVPTVNKPL